jgi:hypothetical protein
MELDCVFIINSRRSRLLKAPKKSQAEPDADYLRMAPPVSRAGVKILPSSTVACPSAFGNEPPAVPNGYVESARAFPASTKFLSLLIPRLNPIRRRSLKKVKDDFSPPYFYVMSALNASNA